MRASLRASGAPEAVVLAKAERHMGRRRRPTHVEDVGGWSEDVFVAVARRVQHHHEIADRNRRVPDGDVFGRGATEGLDRCDPAQQFLDRVVHPFGITPSDLGPLLRMAEQRVGADADEVSRGFVSGDEE